ncbi:MAG: hypothetical protein ACK563_04185 [Pseudomonadaceae bacterium]
MSQTNNKNTLYFHWLLLLWLGCSTLTHAATQQDIQHLRSLSYSVLENVLIYHNPQGIPFDAGNAEVYQRDLQQLRQQSANLGLPDIVSQAEQLDSAIADLHHLPQSNSEMRGSIPPYSLWLPQVIDQQALLATTLAELYTRYTDASPLQRELHGLSRDISRLSLSYQISAFPHLVAQAWILDEQTVTELDAAIWQRFEQLPRQYPETADVLNKLRKRYNFVRRHIATPGQAEVTNAVERYLMSTVRDLDSTAAMLAP